MTEKNDKMEKQDEFSTIFDKEDNNGKIIGKVYNNLNEVVFEGEYKNGQKNGKGKEYNHLNIMVFEGDYKDNKRNGIGTEYNEKGKKVFVGEYRNGQRNGKGKEYNEINELIFEGEYLNNEKNGYGKCYLNNELVYEGQFLNGERNGPGMEYDFVNVPGSDKFQVVLRFKGDYNNGKWWNGFLKKRDNFQIIFEGEYKEGKVWNGIEYEYSMDGDIINEIKYKNGKVWEGKAIEFKDGKISYIGHFKEGKKEGIGKEYNEYGRLEFFGKFNSGIRCSGKKFK